MEALGHPLTYPTACKTCKSRIYFHTNGMGDMVLFDPPLGPPWPIHECYLAWLKRDSYVVHRDATGRKYGVLSSGVLVYGHAPERPRPEPAEYAPVTDDEPEPIVRINADVCLRRHLVPSVTGRVADIVRGKPDRDIARKTGLGADLFARGVGSCDTQITIVDFEPNSYTAYVDLRRGPPLQIGDIVHVRLKPVAVGLDVVFVAKDLDRLALRWDA